MEDTKVRLIGRLIGLVLASAMSLGNVSGCEPASPYRSVSADALSAGVAQYLGTLVMVQGRYEPRGEPRHFIDGHLAGPRLRMRVMGPAFDWIPRPHTDIVAWGRLRQDSEGPYLEFYNGRAVGDTSRSPRVTPDLVPASIVTILARLRQVGNEPFVSWVLETEDRKVVQVDSFPPDFRPLAGSLVQVTGQLRKGGLPPVTTAIQIQRIEAVPGPSPLPFGG